MNKAVTIKDIADKLNMSFSTVSKALNNDPAISSPTRERVKKLAAEWNYIPNEAARHFKLKRTFTLGLIVPTIMDQFYAMAVNGAESIASAEKYNVIIAQTHEDVEKEEKILELMLRNRVDGLILAASKNRQEMSSVKKMEKMGIPVVLFNRIPKENSFAYITSDNVDGAYKATEFLIKKGHTRIAHLMGPESMSPSIARKEGYQLALQKNNIDFDPNLVKISDLTQASTFAAMNKLMKLKSPPTAVFAFKNYISLDAIEFLKQNFPARLKKIDFAGFGNLPLFQYLDHKPLASIEENSYEMGEETAKLLFKLIKEEIPSSNRTAQHKEIQHDIVIH